jgi:ankyrin repeat protein
MSTFKGYFLLKNLGYNLNSIVDDNGRNALHFACQLKNLSSETFDMLFESGADPNFKNKKDGNSGFHILVGRNGKNCPSKIISKKNN